MRARKNYELVYSPDRSNTIIDYVVPIIGLSRDFKSIESVAENIEDYNTIFVNDLFNKQVISLEILSKILESELDDKSFLEIYPCRLKQINNKEEITKDLKMGKFKIFTVVYSDSKIKCKSPEDSINSSNEFCAISIDNIPEKINSEGQFATTIIYYKKNTF